MICLTTRPEERVHGNFIFVPILLTQERLNIRKTLNIPSCHSHSLPFRLCLSPSQLDAFIFSSHTYKQHCMCSLHRPTSDMTPRARRRWSTWRISSTVCVPLSCTPPTVAAFSEVKACSSWTSCSGNYRNKTTTTTTNSYWHRFHLRNGKRKLRHFVRLSVLPSNRAGQKTCGSGALNLCVKVKTPHKMRKLYLFWLGRERIELHWGWFLFHEFFLIFL